MPCPSPVNAHWERTSVRTTVLVLGLHTPHPRPSITQRLAGAGKPTAHLGKRRTLCTCTLGTNPRTVCYKETRWLGTQRQSATRANVFPAPASFRADCQLSNQHHHALLKIYELRIPTAQWNIESGRPRRASTGLSTSTPEST